MGCKEVKWAVGVRPAAEQHSPRVQLPLHVGTLDYISFVRVVVDYCISIDVKSWRAWREDNSDVPSGRAVLEVTKQPAPNVPKPCHSGAQNDLSAEQGSAKCVLPIICLLICFHVFQQ